MEGSQSRRGAPDTAEQLRAVVWELLRGQEYGRASALLETCRIEEKDVVRSLWYEVQYMKLREQLGKCKLTAVQRFRCRKRNPLPCSLRVEEFKTRTLSQEAREQLKAWARGNSASPSRAEREKLMEETRLNQQQIYNWFANYRRKLKKATSQQESVGALNQSPGSPQHSMGRCPQIAVGGSGKLPVTDNYTAEYFEWIKSERQTSVMDYTAATRPGLSTPQCCTSGPPSHQLFLAETDPATLLEAASGYWCQKAEAAHSLAQPIVPLCPCMAMSMAVKLAQTPPLMMTSQPAFPHRLFETALWSSGQFESAATLEHLHPSQDLLRQGSLGLCNRGHLSPDDASPFHSFSNLFLTNRPQSDIRELLREEMVNGGYLHTMCPDAGNASQILLDRSTKGDSSWPRLLPSGASHYLAPFPDGRILAPGGFGGPEEGEAGTEGMPHCVDGEGAGSYRGGLNQPSQAILGECSEDCSPQSNVDGVKIDCRRLTYVKVETEVWCHPQHSQVQQGTKLDIAAQALIQLSQIPIGCLSTEDSTASTDCQRTWES